MHNLRPWTVILLVVLVALSTPLGAAAPAAKSVLLLHSFGREIAPYDAIAAAFRMELKKGSSEPIALYDAYVDAGQASPSNDPQPLIELLRQRFAGSPPDLVVTFGPLAAEFYLSNRDAAFPRGVPLVLAALDARFAPKSALRAGDALVGIRQDLPRYVANILQVLPDTQRIAVVIGDSPLERYWVTQLREKLAIFANRVSFEWLNDLSLEEIRQRVAALPPHSAVLYTIMTVDAAGVPHEGRAGLVSILEAPGTRRHIKAALKLGATMEEIMEVLKLCVIQGVQACNLGLPILEEELARGK